MLNETPTSEKDLNLLPIDELPNSELKLDKHGLPLIPQPSRDPSDPLNWSRRMKFWILFQMALLAFFTTFTPGVMHPTYAQVGIALNKTSSQASYATTAMFLSSGISCFVWSPLANVYGRRTVAVMAQTLAVVADWGSAYAGNLNTLIVGRFFAGLGHGAANVVPYLAVGDIFFLHERGRMLGLVTLAIIAGPHLAPLPGGFMATYIDWRWTLILPAIIATFMWLLLLVGFPETIYYRDSPSSSSRTSGFWNERRLWGFKHPGRKLRIKDFLIPLYMLEYFPVLAVGLHLGVSATLAGVIPNLTASAIFYTYFHFNSAHTGVILSIATTIGGGLGEILAGPVIDYLMLRARQKSNGQVKPESRLHGLWIPTFLLPTGLLIYGFMVEYSERIRLSWLAVSICMAVLSFGVQILTTTCIAYVVDCYKPQTAQTIQLLTFTRSTLSFTAGFWAIPFANRVGFQFAGLTYVLISLLFFVPILVLMRHGERIRLKAGEPSFDIDA